MYLLAYEIDPALVHQIAYAVGGIVLTVLSAIGLGIKQVWAFFKPIITETSKNHNNLVIKLNQQVPLVSDSLSTLCETQSDQCKSLEKHGQSLEELRKLHGEHSEKLDILLNKKKPSSHNLPTVQ